MLGIENNGDVRAHLVNRLAEVRERMIGAILTGSNIVNISASSLATGLLLSWFGDVGVLYATAIMTVVIVVFSEVLPKTVAINAPDRVALMVARPIAWLVRILGPLLIGIEGLVRWILKLFGFKVGRDQAFLSAHEELLGMLVALIRRGHTRKNGKILTGKKKRGVGITRHRVDSEGVGEVRTNFGRERCVFITVVDSLATRRQQIQRCDRRVVYQDMRHVERVVEH